MGPAWDWYRAMLRFSRHVGRHRCLIEREVGAAVHELATRRILHWAADPRVDAQQLRHALADTMAADALTPPLSEALKMEYLMSNRDLDELRVMVQVAALPGGKFGVLDQMVSRTGFAIRPTGLAPASNDVAPSRRPPAALRQLACRWTGPPRNGPPSRSRNRSGFTRPIRRLRPPPVRSLPRFWPTHWNIIH